MLKLVNYGKSVENFGSCWGGSLPWVEIVRIVWGWQTIPFFPFVYIIQTLV